MTFEHKKEEGNFVVDWFKCFMLYFIIMNNLEGHVFPLSKANLKFMFFILVNFTSCEASSPPKLII
jgi:hypothetical protein